MLMDSSLLFSNAQALTVSAASTNKVDMSGGTNFNAGNTAAFGQDMGVGDGINWPQVFIDVMTALTGGTSVNFQIQGSADDVTYTTYAETGAIAAADLVAGAQFVLPMPRRIPGKPLPRYYRVYYTIVGTFGAGTVTAGIVLTPGIWDGGNYPNNYVVA